MDQFKELLCQQGIIYHTLVNNQIIIEYIEYSA